MKKVSVLSILALTAACSGATSTVERGGQDPRGQPAGGAGASTPAPGGTGAVAGGGEGTYSGVYEVPIVKPELAAAATYATSEVHWTVSGGTARLEYDLPVALVGTSIRVEFTGSFDPATNKGTLTGPPGTAECTMTATTVECLEVMRGLLPINADMALIASLAKADYAGPVEHRLEVSKVFIGDPIGVVRFDTSTAATEPEHETEDEKP